MNDEEKKALALAAADFLITNQLTLLRLTATDGKITLSIPTVAGIGEEDLKKLLSNKFTNDLYAFDFEYIKSTATNGTTIIHINKFDS